MLNYDLTPLEKWLIQTKQKHYFWKNETQFYPTTGFSRRPIRIFFLINIWVCYFSDDLKWSMHIDNILNHAYKELGLIKKLKFTLCGNKLCYFCGLGWFFNF